MSGTDYDSKREGKHSSTVNGQEHSFSTIEQDLLRLIEGNPLVGRYGSKLDLLVKRLIHTSEVDLTAKTIVFSAYPRVLELVADALWRNGLNFLSIASGQSETAKMSRYTGGSVNILLLHSEQISAGLNLMATKSIIVIKPLVNSGAERQAFG